jgi:phosphoglycerate dehydrogenase-like enzyme
MSGNDTLRLLHLAKREPDARLLTPAFRAALERFGDLTLVPDAAGLPPAEVAARVRACDVLLTGWGCVPVPTEVAGDPGSLRYVCHLTGTMVGMVPVALIAAGIPVTNWGDATAFEVAEAALALLLTCLKNLGLHIEEKRGDGWRLPGDKARTIGSLRGLRLGLYGCGVIGREFVNLCRPFRPASIAVFDPYAADLPLGVARADSLRELFAGSDAVVIHAGMTDETRGSVTADLLALLPDGGILVNTARGGILDQEAIFAEAASGRLRAALDVLDGDDRLPADHPARSYPNLILTAHQVAHNDWPPRDAAWLSPLQEVALDNLRRFASGEPLRFVMDEARYRRST